MIEAKEHYIAYFDILGYKNLIRQDNSFLDRINNAMLAVMDNFKLMQGFLNLVLTKPDIKIKVFSDNVILFTEVTGNDQIDMINLSTLQYCVKKIQLALMLNAKVFLRGAITKGELFSNKIYIYGKGLVNAVELESSKAVQPRIIVDDCIIYDSKRLTFDPLQKADFLVYQLLDDRAKYIRSVKSFLRRIDKNMKTSYFFDDFYNCSILDRLDDVKANKDNNLDNMDIIYSLVHNLSNFFIINIDSYIKFDDDICFLDYLESHKTKLKSFKRFSTFKELYLYAEKEAYTYQTSILKINPPIDQDKCFKILAKYNWLKEYHNNVAEDVIICFGDYEDLDMSDLLINS